MTRVALRIYIQPGEAEISVALKLKDGSFERMAGIVDTGAETSLFPANLLKNLDTRPTGLRSRFTIQQAGVAGHQFTATEAFVTLQLEDQFGARTNAFEARAWFAETDIALIGFSGILEKSILHIDMLQQTGWLEIDV